MRKAGQYGVSREDTGWENSNAGKCRIRKLSQTPPHPPKRGNNCSQKNDKLDRWRRKLEIIERTGGGKKLNAEFSKY